MRLMSLLCGCALAVAVRAEDPKPAPAPGQWATIKGTVVFPKNKPIPKQLPLNLGGNGAGCPMPILDETTIVNEKNRGIKNVVVFLRPADPQSTSFAKNQIHPGDANRKPATLEITQPCCQFVSRVSAARVGDTIVVKNPAAIVHNFFWDSANSGSFNVNVPPGKDWTMPNPLAAEPGPVAFKCTVHPWMTGYVRIFDHPYYAVTDADGRFQIANVPMGKLRIVYWHETGLRGGKNGRLGEAIDVAGPMLEMQPVEFEVK